MQQTLHRYHAGAGLLCSPLRAASIKPARSFTQQRRVQHVAERFSPLRAVSEAATAAPPGLATVPWDGTPEQERALAELEERMAASAVDTPDQETQQWFLRDRKFDVDAAVKKLEAAQKWRRDFRVADITEQTVAAEMASGKTYLCDHLDVNGRPGIVIRVPLHVTGQYPLEDSKRLCVHMLETALAKRPPGGETLVGIFDLRGFSSKNADLGFVRFLVDIFFTYYPKRLGQVLMVDAPWIFQPGWKMVKPWLRKYAALVRFVSRKELADEFFTPDTQPPEFRP